MAIFAETINGEVVNVIVADTLEIAEQVTGRICVEITDKYVVMGDIIESKTANKVK